MERKYIQISANFQARGKSHKSRVVVRQTSHRAVSPSPQMLPDVGMRVSQKSQILSSNICFSAVRAQAFALYQTVHQDGGQRLSTGSSSRGQPTLLLRPCWSQALRLTFIFLQVAFLCKLTSFFLRPSLTERLVIFVSRDVLSKSEWRHTACWTRKPQAVSFRRPSQLSPGLRARPPRCSSPLLPPNLRAANTGR